MHSDKALFLVQSIFNVQGKPVLYGIVKSGELKNGMVAHDGQRELNLMKIEGNGATMGITVAELNVERAQGLVGKELSFQIPSQK